MKNDTRFMKEMEGLHLLEEEGSTCTELFQPNVMCDVKNTHILDNYTCFRDWLADLASRTRGGAQ